jgi:hypothetical protein
MINATLRVILREPGDENCRVSFSLRDYPSGHDHNASRNTGSEGCSHATSHGNEKRAIETWKRDHPCCILAKNWMNCVCHEVFCGGTREYQTRISGRRNT